MASRPKAAYSERKRLKSTFILTVNCPVYLPLQNKKCRLPLKPIGSALGTGGLDFPIACALLILCYFLFEVAISISLFCTISECRFVWNDNTGQCVLCARVQSGENEKFPQGAAGGDNVFTSLNRKLFQFLRFAQQAGCSFGQIASVIATNFFEVGIMAGNKNQPLDACPKAAKPHSQTEWGPHASPVKRVAWGEAAQGSERSFRHEAETEMSGLCDGEVCSKGLGCFPTSKSSSSQRCRELLFGAFVYMKALLATKVVPVSVQLSNVSENDTPLEYAGIFE